jgi:BMFP domain-containing protein YqiC
MLHFGATNNLDAQLMCIRIDVVRTWTQGGRIVYGCGMFDTKFIDDLARQISDSIPSGVKELQQDLEKNIHTLLQGALAKLDLVTREEFDAQSQVLLRTREKLEQLEKIISALEEKKN